MTKEEALLLTYQDELHLEPCLKTIGLRGGETLQVETWRINGRPKLWKRSPSRFEIPIKHGLYAFGYLTDHNAECFHRAEDCKPIVKKTKKA